MNVDFKTDGNNITVYLVGDIDEYGVRTVKNDIDKLIDDAKGLRSLVFDMRAVTFIDSTGLGFVLGRYKKLRQRRAELLLRNVPKQVDRVFMASGVYSFVPIVE